MNTTGYNLTIILKDILQIEIEEPLGMEYLNGTNITVRYNITDNCNNMVANASTNITMVHEGSGQTFYCSDIVNETSDGWYNCSFNTSGMPHAAYTLMITASKQYYIDDNETHTYQAGQTGFFIETAPVLTDPMMNTTDYDGDPGANGSYLEPRNLSVRVTDPDGDNVDVYFYKRKWTGSGWDNWIEIGFSSCSNCNNSLVYKDDTSYDWALDLGEWQYKMNCSDQASYPRGGGTSYSDEVGPFNYTVEKNDINITVYDGDGDWVWRNGSAYFVLSVKVYNVDQNFLELPGGEANGTWYITKDHINLENVTDPDNPPLNTPNGFFNYSFHPDGDDDATSNCTYDVGNQNWRIFVHNNQKYKDHNSSLFNITIKTMLNGTIHSPVNLTPYVQEAGINITFNFSLYDECFDPVIGVNEKNITLDGPVSYFIANSSIDDEGNGYYLHNRSAGDTAQTPPPYNTTVQAWKQYYSYIIFYSNDSFTVGTRPELQYLSPPVNPSVEGWGYQSGFQFRAQCRDQDNDVMNITLWKRLTPSDGWELIDYKTCQGTNWQNNATFTYTNFDCGDVTPGGWISQFKIRAEDDDGYTEELTPENFTVQRDNVSVVLTQGYDVDVYRNGSGGPEIQLFQVMINDTDAGNVQVSSGVNGTFWITSTGGDFDTEWTNQSDSQGYLNLYFNPNCSYKFGSQKWIGGVYNDACYDEENSTATGHPFNIHGQIINNIDIPEYQDSFNVTENITIRLNTTSECSLERPDEAIINQSYVTFQLIGPNSYWWSCSPTNNETGNFSGYYNCTWDSTDRIEGWWSLQLNSSRGYFNENNSYLEDWFWLENLNASYSNQQVVPAVDGWTRPYNFSIDVNDTDSDFINCSLYINKYDGQGWIFKGKHNLEDPLGIYNQICYIEVTDFTGEDIGDNTFKFFIENGEPENAFNTTNTSGPYLEVSNTSITFITQNATTVNITGDSELLAVRVNDTDNSTLQNWFPSGVNVTFWVTYNSSSINETINQTNQTGYATYIFDPDCSFSIGPQGWWANVTDGYYEMNTTGYNLTIVVTDDLLNNITYPDYTEFDRGVNITINATVVDSCGNNISDANVYFIMESEKDSSIYYCNDTQQLGNGSYSCEFNSSGMTAGWYDVTMASNRTSYNTNHSLDDHTFWLETAPVLTFLGYGVDPQQGGWGEVFNFSVNVTDEDGDTVRVYAYERKYGDASNYLHHRLL
jgi:hypothetical protein